MSGIEESIKKIQEFRESFEGLRTNPRLISIDGPDGAGKTSLIKEVLEKLKEKNKKENKNLEDIIYVKYIDYTDTKSQKRIKELIHKENQKDEKDKDIEKILKFWGTRLNRAYQDHIIPELKKGKTILLDRSEVDIVRGAIEWCSENTVNKFMKYLESGTLTGGVIAGNRIFVSGSPEESWKNLKNRVLVTGHSTHNDPKSLEEMENRIKNEKKAEEIISKIRTKNEQSNIIKISNPRIENETEREVQIKKIAQEIIEKLRT
jgi:thymidylate kinase